MKRLFKILFLLFFAFNYVNAETVFVSQNFDKANKLYQSGKFADAQKLYQKELERGFSADLYYNLANCYYKQNEFGLAILNYERALKLEPMMSDAKHNLALTETKIVDTINSESSFFLKKWKNIILLSLTSNGWVYFSLLFFVLFLAFGLLFIFASTKVQRKRYFVFSILFFIVFINGIFGAISQKKNLLESKNAIILQATVVVRSSPDGEGTELFELHEGTKVRVKNRLDNWVEIKLKNGAVGWVEDTVLEEI